MPATKKRKVSATASQPTRIITAFTKVSKSQVVSKSVLDKVSALDSSATSQLVQKIGLKRKRNSKQEIEDKATAVHTEDILCAVINQAPSLLPQQQSINSRRSLQTSRKPSIEPISTTPTKGERALDILLLSSPPLTKVPLSPSIQSTKNESISTYLPTSQKKRELPTELLDLIHLHSSFLTALSLHYAHNGTQAPVDLRVICPDVAQIWGKRKVILEDIQRTLGILNSTVVLDEEGTNQAPAELSLSDYGHGRICIEIKIGSVEKAGTANPLNENCLNDVFIWKLVKLWECRENVEVSLADFIKNLPSEHITACPSLMKISPLLAKGQQRLADLKAAGTKKNAEEKGAAKALTMVEKTGQKSTLLERLKAKELLQSTLPAPPSKAELAQVVALHRVKEVVKVLSLFSTSSSVGQKRVSFTMQTVLGKLRDSLKTPISREEGETCVRLLASTISPEWLKVVKIGKTDAIVVNRDNRPSDLDIDERVNLAI